MNKKVAGRAEGIEKVEGFLAKQERFAKEQAINEAKERKEKIEELNRLAAQREAEKEAEIQLYLAQQRVESDEEPETPIFKKIPKQTQMKPSNF